MGTAVEGSVVNGHKVKASDYMGVTFTQSPHFNQKLSHQVKHDSLRFVWLGFVVYSLGLNVRDSK